MKSVSTYPEEVGTVHDACGVTHLTDGVHAELWRPHVYSLHAQLG